MAQAIFILNNGRLSSFPEPCGPTRFVEKVSNSPNQEHYIIEIKNKNVVNEETKDYKSAVIIALHKKAL